MQTGCCVLNFDSLSSKSTQSVFTQVFHFLLYKWALELTLGIRKQAFHRRVCLATGSRRTECCLVALTPFPNQKCRESGCSTWGIQKRAVGHALLGPCSGRPPPQRPLPSHAPAPSLTPHGPQSSGVLHGPICRIPTWLGPGWFTSSRDWVCCPRLPANPGNSPSGSFFLSVSFENH